MPDIVLKTAGDYQRQPRRIRRAISRDLARAHPIPPRPTTSPATGKPLSRSGRRDAGQRPGAAARARHRMPVRPASTRSGQARINAKRAQRAAFWDAWTALHANA